MINNLLTTILILFSATCSFSQSTIKGTVKNNNDKAILSGIIKDKDKPISGANVIILNTLKGATTNEDGTYKIKNLSSKTYFVQISFMGYATITKSVTLTKGENYFDFNLTHTSSQLDEVLIFSANRKLEDADKTAGSITAINSKKVTELQIDNINQIGRITPNFRTYDDGGGSFPLVSTRGITTADATPIVGVYIDNVPLFNVSSFPSYFGDIERIEVLKGPQGTLYGRNSIGGVINIISKDPTNYTKSYLTAGYGNLNQYNIQAGISTPLIKDKLFVKLNAGLTQRDGYIENTFLKNKDLLARKAYNGNLKLTYLADDNWTLKLNSGYEHREVNAYALLGGFGAKNTDIQEALKNRPYQVSQNSNGLYTTDLSNNSFTTSFANDNIKFDAITAFQYSKIDIRNDEFDFSPADIQSFSGINDLSTISQEFRVSSNKTGSDWDWVGGLYLYSVNNKNNRRTRNGVDNASNPRTPPELVTQYPYDQLANNKITQKGLSIFGQASYNLTEKLTATAGLRYEIEDSNLDVKNNFEKNDNPFELKPFVVVPKPFEKSTTFDAFSPKVNLAYQANDNSLLYANVTRGYRPGGVNKFVLDKNKATFNPEFSWNYEIGIKNKLFNNKLKLNLATFYIDYKDQQLYNIIDISTYNIGKQNIGNSRNIGVELESEFVLTKGLNFIANVGYLNTEFTDYSYTDFKGKVVNNKGKNQVVSPEWSGNLGLNYAFNISEKWKSTFTLDYQFQSEIFFDPENTASQEGYGLLNARFVVGSKNLEFSIWGQNIADVTYLSYGHSVNGSVIMVSYGLPVTFGTGITLKL